jgi:hypothetical protein
MLVAAARLPGSGLWRAIPLRTAMTLLLRRIIWDDGKPSGGGQNFEVIDQRGQKVGRIESALKLRPSIQARVQVS